MTAENTFGISRKSFLGGSLALFAAAGASAAPAPAKMVALHMGSRRLGGFVAG